MNNNITSREDIFLAKIAGKDVDIKTMTPPVATNMTEKLMLDIADRIDNIEAGGGGDEYETVAEIEVGTMVQGGGDGLPSDWFYGSVNMPVFEIKEGDTFYLNDKDNPSDSVMIVPDTAKLVLFNCEFVNGEFIAIDSAKPSYVIIDDDDGVDNIGVCCSENISNTTVRILKKVSGGGSITVDDALSDTSENPVQNKVIAAALANKSDAELVLHAIASEEGGSPVVTVTDDGITFADVLAAASDEKKIRLLADLGGGTVLECFCAGYHNAEQSNIVAFVGFGQVVSGTSISIVTYYVGFAGTLTGSVTTAMQQID